jgi:single-strand DNA-binding protein
MAKSVNCATLLGNVGKDPEIRALPSGTKVANFSLATTERYKDQQGNWQDRTEWHNLVAYARLADVTEKYVKKGTQLYVEGKIETHSWDDRKSGEKRYQTQIRVDELVLLGGTGTGSGQPQTRTTQAGGADDWDDFR